ncbi:MAG: winged helix-turn-helix domain-containing protein [Candidatus Methanoperedens sp.]|nr:winged helix-turn-helix domain-containing protein [Candidatus Methanoperedens sp.]CAG0996701.1 hypothetical protein METP1_02614 [Methanosarcinales archaeon]
MKTIVDPTPLITEAQKTNFANLVHQQEIEGYKIQIQQLIITVQNLTGDNKKLKEAHSIEVTKNDTVSKTLKEAQLELTRKDDMIKTLTDNQNTSIKRIVSMTEEAVTMTEKNSSQINELSTKTIEIKDHIKSIPTRIQEMKTGILRSNEEFKDEIQDTTDALLRTRFDEFEVNIFTEVSKIVSNIQIPTPTIDVVALENNIIVAMHKHEADNRELMMKNVKEYIDSIPKPTTETPNLDAFYDKIILVFDEKLEKLELQSDLIQKAFNSYYEKIELLMKAKEAPITKPTIDDTHDELLPENSKPVDIITPIITPIRSKDILTPNQKKIYDFLKENPHQKNKEISEHVEIAPGNLSPILKAMVEKSIIIKNVDDSYEVITPIITNDTDIEL